MITWIVSSCCGASPRGFCGPGGTPDCDSTDFGICPACGEHCEFERFDEEEDQPCEPV